jgi:hypothetical protein
VFVQETGKPRPIASNPKLTAAKSERTQQVVENRESGPTARGLEAVFIGFHPSDFDFLACPDLI